jgi:hypothetical protein
VLRWSFSQHHKLLGEEPWRNVTRRVSSIERYCQPELLFCNGRITALFSKSTTTKSVAKYGCSSETAESKAITVTVM